MLKYLMDKNRTRAEKRALKSVNRGRKVRHNKLTFSTRLKAN